MKDGLDNYGFCFGSSDSKTVNLAAGTKLTIEGKEYTVIECNGTQCKPLATDTFQKAFDDNNSNNYTISTIATYLDDYYYNSLDPKIKSAIVETTIQQKASSTGYEYSKNSPTWTGETKDAGTHKVFIPSWDEVTKAYGSTLDELKAYALDGQTWLRDTYGSYVLYVFNDGGLNGYDLYFGYFVRPTFVLDLSIVNYTVN